MNNDAIIKLLYHDPQKLIIELQHHIEKIVNYYISCHFISNADKHDYIQTINEELLIKIPAIQQQFNKNFLLLTYITTIIRNICKEYINKKRNKNLNTKDYYQEQGTTPFETSKKIAIKEEIERLRIILSLFGKQRPKVELCLKLKFSIPAEYENFKNYFPKYKKSEYNIIKKKLNQSKIIRDYEIYSLLTELINKAENKNNSQDAVRKWIKTKSDEIINLLNGMPKVSMHTEETLKILFELLFLKTTK